MKYDLIVVGCGFSGATIAYCAAKQGKKVLILERRSHIAGNMYDYYNEDNILVQKYGPHSFHTNDEEVYQFIAELTEWEEYILRARVEIDGAMTPSPFNFATIDLLYEVEEAKRLKQKLRSYFKERDKITIIELLQCEDSDIKGYANLLFEKDYRPYTSKQWGISPEQLDISVLSRVPVRLSYVDRYFDDKYQLLPQKGFTNLFKEMLSSENIEVRLNIDALDLISLKDNQIIFEGEVLEVPCIYTGPIDELFKMKYGSLPYRSLDFDLKTLNVKSYQETSGVAYPMAEGYTRITEYTKIPVQDVGEKTTIAIEYPVEYGSEKGKEAYYPILTNQSQDTYSKYLELSKVYHNLYLCGRLADFKYYNMDDAIKRAINVFKTLKF